MHKKLYLLFIAAMIAFTHNADAQRRKSEFTMGYGFYSGYQFANLRPYNTSTGTLSLSYRYYVSGSVTLGLGVGMERIDNWAGFTTFSPEVTVKYLDTKNNSHVRVRLYGMAAWGLSILNDLHVGKGQADESGAKPWGVQITPIGMRVGRQFAGFMEIGYGYKGIFHTGIAFRFPRTFVKVHNEEETTY